MLARYRRGNPVEFCVPSNRTGLQADLGTVGLLGRAAFACDVTQVADIDDLLAPQGAIAEAEQLAAALWKARSTHFLVNGTSSGIQAAFLAFCGPRDEVAVPRASHRSVLEGFILSGAIPRWIPCDVDPTLGCAVPPARDVLQREATGARMAVLTRPTYYGDVADLAPLAQARRTGTIIMVDEAWGAHFGHHPRLPSSACQGGADIVVNSTHKTLGALSGGSMIHCCSDSIDDERLASAVRALTTTSPYYGILASLDGARRDLACHGRDRLKQVLEATQRCRDELDALGLRVADASRAQHFDGVSGYDETRIAFSAARRGWSGTELAAAIERTHRVVVELAETGCIVAQVAGEIDVAALPTLTRAVRATLEGNRRDPLSFRPLSFPQPEPVMTPRQAWQASHERVTLERAMGRIAAEMVCPYPPGMAVVSYGERITAAVHETLLELRSQGRRLQGCADSSLGSVRVVA